MNLLSVLLSSMLTDSALSSLSKKTGLSTKQLRVLIPVAVPLLLRFLTNNASSQSGATSLLGALTQHTSTKTLDQQFAAADTEDGAKIVRHILGDDTQRVVETLAAETNLSDQQVSKALDGLAPALLCVLSAVIASQHQQQQQSVNLSDGLDLSEMLTLFGGAAAQQPVQQQSASTSLLNALLGGGMQQAQPVQQQSASTSLLNALLGGGQPVQQVQPVQQQSGSLLGTLLGLGSQQPVQQVQPVQQQSGSLLGTLLGLGGTQQVQPVQQSANNVNGNTLVSLLLNALR